MTGPQFESVWGYVVVWLLERDCERVIVSVGEPIGGEHGMAGLRHALIDQAIPLHVMQLCTYRTLLWRARCQATALNVVGDCGRQKVGACAKVAASAVEQLAHSLGEALSIDVDTVPVPAAGRGTNI